MKRTALYLRVSTLDQHPETQLHDLRQLAQQRGLEIIVTYTDYLSSTKVRRPKLEQMLTDACRRLGAGPRAGPYRQPAGEQIRDRPDHRPEAAETGGRSPAKRVPAIAFASS
jgi:hypothetical protein